MDIYFSDFFHVDPRVLDDYGAFDVSLVNDLPLFVDPFLLFNSEKPEYRDLHDGIIEYMRFLRDVSLGDPIPVELRDLWFTFPEVKQNWFGYSLQGNGGHGLGVDFARALHKNFRTVFQDFGSESVTRASHIEKLCLIRDGVGRDNLSDFTTNLIKGYLAEYTQTFATAHIDSSRLGTFALAKAAFNYTTQSWVTRQYVLPANGRDFVLLTPKDILTKDETWINRTDLLHRLTGIADALPDAGLRAQVNAYLVRVLPADPKATRKEIDAAISTVLERFPQLLDYYIREKEATGDRAVSSAKARVSDVEDMFIEQVRALVDDYLEPAGFYSVPGNTYDEAMARLGFLKDVIENKGGHRLFYVKGQPVERESDLHILYRLTWFATLSDVSREVNDGRGPADFKVSRGAPDKTLVEFKLAKNTKLEQNLAKQTAVYEAASDTTNPSVKCILYFSAGELRRVEAILKRLGIENSPHVVLIDARDDNKPSGSVA